MNPYQRRIREALDSTTRPNYRAALRELAAAALDVERGLLTVEELVEIAREAQ